MSARPALFDISSPSEPTMADFVADGNEELLALAQSLAGGDRRAVLVWGPRGCGKSHLLSATQALAAECGLETETGADYERVAMADLVVTDDVHLLDSDGQTGLFRLLDRNRTGDGPALLLSASHPPVDLDMREDLRTRLGACIVIAMRRLDDDAMRRALLTYARRIGRPAPEDVIDYLLMRQTRDFGSLLELFRGMDRYAIERDRPLSARTAREWCDMCNDRKTGEAEKAHSA